jgi:hypothetical protein
MQFYFLLKRYKEIKSRNVEKMGSSGLHSSSEESVWLEVGMREQSYGQLPAFQLEPLGG